MEANLSPVKARPQIGAAFGALLLAALIVITFHPGIMTKDSIAVLRQARSLQLTDWHPPLLALLWRPLDALHRGPALMLAAQALLYAVAVSKFCIEAGVVSARQTRAWLAPVAFGVFPPILALTGMMWKDIWMSVFLFLGLAYLLQLQSASKTRERVWTFLAVVACCTLATAFRHNALAATAGMLAGAFFYMFRRTSQPMKSLFISCAAGVCLAVVLGVVVGSVNRSLTTASHPESSILLHDIAGTILRTNRPTETARQFALDYPTLTSKEPDRFLEALSSGYSPASANGVLRRGRHPNAPFSIIVYSSQHDAATIRRAWKQMVTSHPIAYLRHRAAAFRCLLQLCDLKSWQFHSYVLNSNYMLPHDLKEGSPQFVLRRILFSTALSRLYAPALWLAILLAGCAYGMARLRSELSVLIFIGLSAVGLAVSLFFTSPIESYRYAHWIVLAGWSAIVITLNSARQKVSLSVPVSAS